MANFDSKKFISELAKELLETFDKVKNATTPGLKGAARENIVRKKLENILPSGVGVGSGCVIDHKGNASKQQDVILYEKNICSIFSIAETPEATYYPCEGVIAVGEIKTSISKKELADSFSKIESVKKLKRFPIKSKSLLRNEEMISFRKYLSRTSFDCTKDEEFDQEKNAKDQIYGFIFCRDFNIKIDTLSKHILNNSKKQALKFLPNILIALDGSVIKPYDIKTNKLHLSTGDCDSYIYGRSNNSGSFEYLVADLYKIIKIGRSVEVGVFEHYIINEPQKMSLSIENKISLAESS